MKINFKNVSKNFGIISALKDVSFDVEPGEFVFVVGPSGSGKSTLLKLILNQITPTSGQVLLNDIDLKKINRNHIDNIRRKIGVIFQDYQLIFDKTVEENISLALDIVSFPKSKIAPKVDEVIKQVNLSSRRYLFPSQLSGGELQRTALARALAIEPDLILADEPTGNLDVLNSWNLVKLLSQINKTYHTTIIMTTHNQDIVESLNKRIIDLKSGIINKDTSNLKPISHKRKKIKTKHDST